MATITYIEHGGREHVVEVELGSTVMQGAVDNMIDGILAECGGACSCATCHCYIDDHWRDRVGPPSEVEKDMLEFASEPQANSRLSCQVKVTEAMDGLVVRLPESQY
ncbi:MAG: 2Fe-2S iron-sulfur cluster-binding protein [Parahaliea sp.]